ncbi:amino acid ABC transporter permease [Candidatus Babeliales bacterium]|nr:amino acid ABC transporter permease [Candidatus Babeliales bacterium]
MINIETIQEYGLMFLHGAIMSLYIAMLSCMIGIFLGTIAGIILAGSSKILKFLITAYVTIIRGTPMLIQVAAMYFILNYVGILISALNSAIISIGLNSGAYLSQIVLSGIKSVGKGQVEAAKVLGFTKYQIMRLIVLPQAICTMIPAFGNELVTLVKDSSLASTIGVYELSKQGQIILSHTYDAPTVYFAVGFMYLSITSIISLLVSMLDKKLNKYAHR